EVRNNLVPMKLYLSLLRRRISHDAGSGDIVQKLTTGVAALETMVDDLLNFTADREPQWRTVAVLPLVKEILDGLGPQLAAQGIRCELEVAPHHTVFADREMLRRAVVNLVLNAIDAMPDGGELCITSFVGSRGFELEVADSGPGLPEETLERLFEPFFTTKREGTGLGLAIVQRIAESHGASVAACNCPEGGAAFTLRFPPQAMERAA